MGRQKGSGQGHAHPGKTGAEDGFYLNCQSGKAVKGVREGSDSLVQHADRTLHSWAGHQSRSVRTREHRSSWHEERRRPRVGHMARQCQQDLLVIQGTQGLWEWDPDPGLSSWLGRGRNVLALTHMGWWAALRWIKMVLLDTLKKIYWSIVALQCCASFCYTAKWISYMYTHIPSFLNFLPI